MASKFLLRFSEKFRHKFLVYMYISRPIAFKLLMPSLVMIYQMSGSTNMITCSKGKPQSVTESVKSSDGIHNLVT